MDSNVEMLTRGKLLQFLDISHSPLIGIRATKAISECNHMRHLNLSCCRLSASDLRPVLSCEGLISLGLNYTGLDSTLLREIASKFKALVAFAAAGTNISSSAVKRLLGNEGLVYVDISECVYVENDFILGPESISEELKDCELHGLSHPLKRPEDYADHEEQGRLLEINLARTGVTVIPEIGWALASWSLKCVCLDGCPGWHCQAFGYGKDRKWMDFSKECSWNCSRVITGTEMKSFADVAFALERDHRRG